MVSAQLVERLLPTSEIRGSNPVIDKILSVNCTIEKTKIKKKRPGMAHFLRTFSTSSGVNLTAIFQSCVPYKFGFSRQVASKSATGGS